ncbi:MAG: Mov34/MPN/PAD-1 family protein [Thermomicrobiales bacterium]
MVTWKQTWTAKPIPHDREAFIAERSLPRDAASLDPLIAIDNEAWGALLAHTQSERVEVGGMLLGDVYEDGRGRIALDIRHAIPALGALQEPTYFKLTTEAWDHICTVRDTIDRDMLIVGWYHSHPGLGAFYSGTDRASQKAFYNEPWNIGLVYDPQRDDLALFLGGDSRRLGEEHLQPFTAVRQTVWSPVADGLQPPLPAAERRPVRWVVPSQATAAALAGIVAAAALRRILGWPR